MPSLADRQEIIFVEGGSSDGTREAILGVLCDDPARAVRLVDATPPRGKADAVHRGVAAALNDVILILDADLTVSPSELPEFINMLLSGRADFVNGSRFLRPMERRAMRFLNGLGNRFYARMLSLLTGWRLTDSLCGTKVFYRKDYARIMDVRRHMGVADPFGDFELLLGAASAGMRIGEVPVSYKARQYGETKISRFRDGFRLGAICLSFWRRHGACRRTIS